MNIQLERMSYKLKANLLNVLVSLFKRGLLKNHLPYIIINYHQPFFGPKHRYKLLVEHRYKPLEIQSVFVFPNIHITYRL